MEARTEYTRRLRARRSERERRDRTHLRLGSLRLLLLAGAAGLAYLALAGGGLSGWWLLVPVVGFLALGRAMGRVELARERLDRSIRFYEDALARLDGDWAGNGTSGLSFLSEEHLYAADLDLFGHGSLYELLCAARTGMGRATLADWLLEPASPSEVESRQEAVSELTGSVDLREDLAVLGQDAGEQVDPRHLIAWGEQDRRLDSRALRWAARGLAVVGAVTVLALLTWLVGIGGTAPLGEGTLQALRLWIVASLVPLGLLWWRTRRPAEGILHDAEAGARELALVAELLARIETADFDCDRLQDLRAGLESAGAGPSARIDRLDGLIDLVHSRDNVFVRLFGPLLLWDLNLALALEDWRAASGHDLRGWLEAVGEIEALASLAAYRYEHPDDPFPELMESGPRFVGEALGHPLLPADEMVPNDVRLDGQQRILVVSGSNMSGKSTLLRTVGVNAVLAQAGAPVRARRLELSPLRVGASIRIHDSLREGESRFYAEITRIREIMALAEGDTPALFLIDELLHGTNSRDRRVGAEGIVRGFLDRGAVGLLTTHDLALTELPDSLPEAVNVHFEDQLQDGELDFDYRLRPGVVERSNAIELMRSVGLDV